MDASKTVVVSRSLIMLPQLAPSTIGGTVLKKSNGIDILGFDSKMIFEKHLRSISRAAS